MTRVTLKSEAGQMWPRAVGFPTPALDIKKDHEFNKNSLMLERSEETIEFLS